MSVGKPNHNASGGNFKKIKRFYPKEAFKCRLLPPHGKLAQKGYYSQFHRCHWGYEINIKGKVIKIPFECCREIDFRSKEIINDCLVCVEKVDPLENQYKTKEAEFIAAGLDKDQKNEAMRPWNEKRMKYSREGKHYYNVMNEAGEIGVYGIPTKAKQALDLQIKKCLQEYHFDPIDADGGCWFIFSKSGTGGATTHSVEIAMEMVSVTLADGTSRQYPDIKRAPLTPEIIGRMDDEAGDLTDVFPKLTLEDQRRLLDSGGDPEVYKAILDRARPVEKETYSNGVPKTEPAKAPPAEEMPAWDKTPAPAVPAQDPRVAALKAAGLDDGQIKAILAMQAPTAPVTTTEPPKATPAPVAPPKATPTAPPKPAEPTVDPEEAALMAQLAALKAKKNTIPATPAPKSPPAPVAPPADDGELDDEQWAAMAYGQASQN